MFKGLILTLIFALLSKTAGSYQFQMCQKNGGYCTEEYNEGSFNSSFVNELFNNDDTYFKTYLISLNLKDDDEDLVLNLDGFDPRMFIRIQNSYFQRNLTLQTSYTEYSEKTLLPQLEISYNFNVIIENLNDQNNETLVLYDLSQGSFDSIRPKDADKHLHFFAKSFSIAPNRILDSPIYISSHIPEITIYQGNVGENPLTFIFKFIPIPILNNRRYEYNQGILLRLNCGLEGIFTFGDHEMRYEVPETNISYTFISDSDDFYQTITFMSKQNTTMKVEDGVSSIFPTSISASIPETFITIQGKWRPQEFSYKSSYTLEGKYYAYFSFYQSFYGSFIFETDEFHCYNDIYFGSLWLTNEVTNIYMHSSSSTTFNSFIYTNESLKNPKLYLNGAILRKQSNINSNSKDLRVYLRSESSLTSNATIIYKEINNEENSFDSETTYGFQKGGIVQMPFSLYFNDEIDKIYDIIEDYEKEHPLGNDENSFRNYANHYINLAKNKISEIKDHVNQIHNKFIPINISVVKDSNSNKKNVLAMKRKDYPASFLYKNNIGKEQDVICDYENGININDWTFRHPIQINPMDPFMYPSATESGFTGEFVSTKGGKCIGYKQKSVPNSVAEIIIYTKNETFTNILSQLEVFVVLGPNDLDVTNKMNNPNAKNIVILVLDDLPDGKRINLNNVNPSANIIMIGFDSSTLEEAYDLAFDFRGASEDEVLKKVTSILKDRSKYQVKAGLTLNRVQTLLVGLIQYTGTSIQCTNFIPILSTFESLITLNAAKTITESVTYSSLNNVQLNDLILAPATIDPLTPLSVNRVYFGENSWTLELEDYLKKGQVNSHQLSISMQNVKGQLYLYSLTTNCVYSPTSSATKVKGISLHANFLSFFGMDDIPTIITLEDHPEQSTLAATMKKIAKSFFNMNDRSSSAKLLSNRPVTISFEGDWSKISTVNGEFEIKTGYSDMYISSLPSNIANKIKVDNQKSININTNSNEITIPELRVHDDINFISFNNENQKVNFGSIVVIYGSSTISLKLGNKNNCPINAQNVVIPDSSRVTISSQLTVNNLLELGYDSSILCESINIGENTIFKLGYRLRSNFPSIPDVKPKQIILNYVGESDNFDDYHDYSEYLNVAKTVKTFDSSSKCQEWLNIVEFDSQNYPSFRKGSKYISASCQDTSLVIKLIAIPTNDDVVPNPTKSFDITYPQNPTKTSDTSYPQNPTTNPVNPQPVATPEPIEDNTAKEDKPTGTVTITDDKDKNIENIQNQFSSDTNTDKSDQYVKVDVDKNKNEVDLSGINLDKGQYLQVPDDKPVKLESGNLNILLNENAKKATVDIANNENTALSIKNKEDSEVVIKTKSTKVSINSNSEVYAALTLTVPSKVVSVKVDSVNLHSTGTIKAQKEDGTIVPLTVGNLVAQAQTKCTLSEVQIAENLEVVQSASLALENVKFGENAKLNVNLRTYSQGNFNEPILHGTFSDSPSQILMKKPENSKEDSIVKDYNYLLFRGDFVNGCDKWKDAVAFEEGTLFNKKSCNEINAGKMLLESRSLVVSYEKKSKLSAGQIAGIVIGCVAGVGIIVAVIVIVVIKMKKRQNSEDESNEV